MSCSVALAPCPLRAQAGLQAQLRRTTWRPPPVQSSAGCSEPFLPDSLPAAGPPLGDMPPVVCPPVWLRTLPLWSRFVEVLRSHRPPVTLAVSVLCPPKMALLGGAWRVWCTARMGWPAASTIGGGDHVLRPLSPPPRPLPKLAFSMCPAPQKRGFYSYKLLIGVVILPSCSMHTGHLNLVLSGRRKPKQATQSLSSIIKGPVGVTITEMRIECCPEK